MNIIKKIINNNIFVIIFCLVVSELLHVVADTYLLDSKEVSFSNSKMQATNVQGAVDELYGTATDYSNINNRLTTLETSYLDKVYPVGSIYLSTTLDTTTKVTRAFGGTWEAYGKGKTLVGLDSSDSSFDTVEESGGNKTTTIAVTNLPSHTHTVPSLSVSSWTANHTHTGQTGAGIVDFMRVVHAAGGSSISNHTVGYDGSNGYHDITNTSNFVGSGHYHTFTTDSTSITVSGQSTTEKNTLATGSGEALSVQNPYITVYMYKRTA